ncbi:CoA transferase [Rhodobacteraceae bacterium NNCM2]|nr:CoA transferase [Coraliihabitans acroporae]
MRPFEGLRVLDLTHVFAGPFATYQLAVLGADVIKIEPPTRPDFTRFEGADQALNDAAYGIGFLGQNGGKRALTLDLRPEAGKQVMRRLIANADVLVQNYAGPALADLGFGAEAALEINPRLIYCTISGYGATGPKRAHPAYDVVIQAYSGIMAANGTAETAPVRVGPPMVDFGTGAQAAMAISAALYQREQTGKGQVIDVSMLDSALMLMSAHVAETIAVGAAPDPHGNAHPSYAGYRSYPTAEGMLMVGAFTTAQLVRLMEALSLPERAAALRDTPRAKLGETVEADAELIAARLMTRTAQEWEDILNAAHVPAARVRRIEETLAEEQIATRGVLQDCPDLAKAGGPARLPVAGFTYAHGSATVDRAPPKLGEHTDETLLELGLTQNEIDSLRQAGVI